MYVLTNDQRDSIEYFARSSAAKNDPHHSFAHLKETAELAENLAGSESADKSIVWTAGMLHDICKNEPGDHGALGAKKASLFLASIGLPKPFVDSVYGAIYSHNKELDEGPIERMVVWDADKLPLMNPEGFMSRMLPYWVDLFGKEAGTKRAIDEYYFFRGRFHTETARKIVASHRGAMEALISDLGGGKRSSGATGPI